VIVRIATEGQYEIEDGAVDKLNALDNEAVAACDADDEARFRTAFHQLLELIRTEGRALGEDELEGSDLILPPPDVSLEEAKAEFSGEGLIPG
jgi:PspA-Associated protein